MDVSGYQQIGSLVNLMQLQVLAIVLDSIPN
jgi:hypothetical protein